MYVETPYNLERAQYTLYFPIFLQKKTPLSSWIFAREIPIKDLDFCQK